MKISTWIHINHRVVPAVGQPVQVLRVGVVRDNIIGAYKPCQCRIVIPRPIIIQLRSPDGACYQARGIRDNPILTVTVKK